MTKMCDTLRDMPQWTTTGRLLKTGEGIEFEFFLPDGITSEDLVVFPHYLERAHPGKDFVAGGDLNWLDALPAETCKLDFVAGRAGFTYHPGEPGNYIARWRAGREVFYRHFALVEDDWIVLNFSTFGPLEAEPTLHGCGIPLDYRLPVEKGIIEKPGSPGPEDCLDPASPLFQRFLGYQRHYGDNIIPHLPDTPDLTPQERIQRYGAWLEKARALLPDGVRSARVDMFHDLDPGYTETFMALGINDHCGLNEANARPWLGMPEFPYFSSPLDCRKVHQEQGGSVMAHQWDFCGGWHFLGPVSWHYAAAEGQWEVALECLRQGMEEAKNLAELSGHPAFLFPLYDGVIPYKPYPNRYFSRGYGDREMARFVEQYQRQMAFEFTRQYKLVYARSIDIADYYRNHFEVTPRTVFVSKTNHVLYDMWWLCHWCNEQRLVPRERIPRETRISTIMEDRRTARVYYKDPLSHEYILVEDRKRSIRFERESPNPIWWFDYTRQTRGRQGSEINHVETPDVDVLRFQQTLEDGSVAIRLKMITSATFNDYAVAVWGLPSSYTPERFRIETDAGDFVIARNTDGEFHLILFFDLTPGAEIRVDLKKAQ